MDAYTGYQLVVKAGKLAHMSNDEAFAFNKEVQLALLHANGMDQDVKESLMDAYVKSTERVSQIRETQKNEVKQAADARREEERRASDPRQTLAALKADCETKLKNPTLSDDARKELKIHLNAANAGLEGWRKNDGEQQRTADLQQQFAEARQAHDRAAELGAL